MTSYQNFFRARPHLRIRLILQALYRRLTRPERWAFLALFLLAVVSVGGLAQAQPTGPAHWRPVAGGTYRGAVLLDSPRDRSQLIDSLTKVGLVQLADDGTLQPALAQSWQISDNRQTLTLHLVDRVSAATALKTLQEQAGSGYWDDAHMSALDAHTLQFQLDKPWAGFVTELGTPVFPFGPYRLDTRRSKSDYLLLNANPQALLPPYLTKLEFHLYTNQSDLQRALRKGGLDGAYLGESADGASVPNGWQTLTSQLPDQDLVFFNLRQDSLKDIQVRQRLINFSQFDQPLTLHMAVPDSPQLQLLATNLATRWAQENVTVQIDTYPILSFTESILPKHTYDMVLLGIDYGPDGDLYPYWDSSQIAAPGLNFAGYRNQKVDQLLTQARQEPDTAKRHDLFKQAQMLISTDAAFLPLTSPKATFIRSAKIKGPVPAVLPLADDRWSILAGWYRNQRRQAA